jgi:hypothetical protein
MKMKRAVSKVFRAVGALQIVLLTLWIASYPLHFAFGFSDADRLGSSHSGECETSCCKKPAFRPHCTDNHSLSESHAKTACNICDFALQLASSSLSAPFSMQIARTFICEPPVCGQRLSTTDFLLYFSRGPPPEMIG